MSTIMKMLITYIEQVDDENFLTLLMMERDYQQRDSLRIAADLELIEMIS